MHKNTINNITGTVHDRESCIKTSQSVNRKKLAGIKNLIDAIGEKIDLAFNHLCMDLPKINMEIFRTFNRALESWDLLNSDGSTGKIDSTLSYIENLFGTVSSTILHEMKQYRAVYAAVVSMNERLDAMGHINNNFTLDKTTWPPRAQSAELINTILRIQKLQESIITDIDSHLDRDIKSLKETLNTMILIFRDLIERSNSTKGPILKIMSKLQVHDIIRQDINTISDGLSLMQPLEDLIEENENAVESIIFWEKVSQLSCNLITQLISLIKNQGSILDTEINSIEETVSRIKEDKDNIADFLLMNEQWDSAFDIAISEISEIMGSILCKIEEYTSMKAVIMDLFSAVLPFGNELEQHRAVVEDCVEDKHLIRDFKEAIIVIKDNLMDIKSLLIESIQGIDIYSKRCGESIQRFRQDIKNLIESLYVSNHILDELQAFSCWANSIQAEVRDEGVQSKRTIETKELRELLYRLENPHSNTIIFDNLKDPHEGITFF